MKEADLSALAMIGVKPIFGGSSHATGNGFGEVSKITEVLPVPANTDSGPPLQIPLGPINSANPALVVATKLLVPSVTFIRNYSDIGDPVVRRGAVDMVNFTLRPPAMDDRPYNSVRLDVALEDKAVKIAIWLRGGESRSPCVAAVPLVAPVCSRMRSISEQRNIARKPKKLPGLRLIPEQLAAQFGRDIGSCSHGEESLRCGQGRALRKQRFRPAFHSRFTVRSQTSTGEVRL